MRRALWAAALLVLAGCGALAPVAEPPVTSSLLDQWPTDLPKSERLPATLLVYPPQAGPLLDSTRMAYTLRPHHLAFYSQNQWAEPPPRMLQPLLVRTLEAAGRFSAVQTPPRAGPPAYALHSEVLELVQDYAQDPPVLRLALRLQLSDERAGRLLATREIRLQQPMLEKTPYGGVVAANAALARALLETALFVQDATR